MTTNTIRVGDVVLTRIGYADVNIDPARVGLTGAQVAGVDWAEPLWADGAEPRAGAAVWIIESGDARIAVDPAQAADEVLRTSADASAHQEAFAALMAAAGFPRESITHAISTHVEGIGMWAWRNDDGSWAPFFPNATISVPQRDLDAIDAGDLVADTTGAVEQFRALGVVQGADHGARVTGDVTLEHVGAHTPGHQVVRISSGGELAFMIGHLAVTPLHLVTGECPQQHPDPRTVQEFIDRLLKEDAVLIGPLWPTPGAGRWDGEQLVAVSASLS